MASTTNEFPTMQAIQIKTAIVTSIPTCNEERPRGSLTSLEASLKLLRSGFVAIIAILADKIEK